MTKKVCSKCGNDSFVSERLVYQEVSYDGNGNIVQKGTETPYDGYEQVYSCGDCMKVYNSFGELVSEDYFHTVIAVHVQDGA